VRDSRQHPVTGAIVRLHSRKRQSLTVRTDSAGAYLFSRVRQGAYTLRAEMAGYSDATSDSFVLSQKESRAIDLTLESAKASEPQIHWLDGLSFSTSPLHVAGVTDTTNLAVMARIR